MPVISRFYGIIIRMYFFDAEHNPPHVHAIYAENAAEVDISTGIVLDGNLPPKALNMVREWIEQHRKELLEMWEKQEFKALSPLE